ncbi:nicotinate (nicotinamide) nucleotide adenylyltransferase [Haliangium ochraceum]|uniref:Probable nicotinate-nucleotide adenylyltransferase n=1 Tax=Haliangium ochraceum (strain DSM 14365 / JCM 11303 / SMP-2) TaxID=502025 RepID=D0LY68_HALO1|nr:nicotinate (nicotinamide) nucleotide adenylyltransferase [Haliangium ochraceum]ACY16218.1 nicotinate (nicotinamide) nucleotide adenylyltransferase [Haliangium ochraceum DSM 14365]
MSRAHTVGLFGGSFNPPHVAHQMLMLYVLETCALDELWMMPTYRHAFAKELLAFEHRMRMCELASAALGQRVRVSRIEADLARPVSRTLETVLALRERHPDTQFRLIVGADVLKDSDKWYRWDDVVAHAPPITVGRSGHGGSAVDLPAVSSTEIRERLAEGASIAGLVPRAVADYIAAQGLYS